MTNDKDWKSCGAKAWHQTYFTVVTSFFYILALDVEVEDWCGVAKTVSNAVYATFGTTVAPRLAPKQKQKNDPKNYSKGNLNFFVLDKITFLGKIVQGIVSTKLLLVSRILLVTIFEALRSSSISKLPST